MKVLWELFSTAYSQSDRVVLLVYLYPKEIVIKKLSTLLILSTACIAIA